MTCEPKTSRASPKPINPSVIAVVAIVGAMIAVQTAAVTPYVVAFVLSVSFP